MEAVLQAIHLHPAGRSNDSVRATYGGVRNLTPFDHERVRDVPAPEIEYGRP
jgi:hypothetical protein